MEIGVTLPLVLKPSKWENFLGSAKDYPEIYFVQYGKMALHRNEDSLKEFLQPRDYGNPIFNGKNFSYELSVSSLQEKNEKLDQLVTLLKRYSHVGQKTDKIIGIAEEVILNVLVSAPKAAEEKSLSSKPSSNKFCFMLEWNDEEIWIHSQDPYGAFSRENFQKSFRTKDAAEPSSHGNSGKGMEIILNLCTDLYIKSSPDWGTWISARVDLLASNKENEIYPKRLLLDFK